MKQQKQSSIAAARRRIMVTKNLLDTMEKYVEAMEPEIEQVVKEGLTK